MNNAKISGEILTEPELRYTSNNQTPVTEFMLEVPGLKEDNPSHSLKVLAWGNFAQEVAEKWSQGDWVLVVGRLEINTVECPEGFKEKRATLNANKVIGGNLDADLNIVDVVGRAGGLPDVKYFESGSSVSKVNIAVDRPTKSKEPDWVSLEAWGKTGEVMANWVKTGSLVGVTGSLKWDTWQDKNTGADRSAPVVRVDNLRLLGRGEATQPEGDAGVESRSEPVKAKSKPKTTAGAKSGKSEPAPDVNYDDIPF